MNCDYSWTKRSDRTLKVYCDEVQTINYKRTSCYHTRFTIFHHTFDIVIHSSCFPSLPFFDFTFSVCFHNPIPKSTCDKTLSSIPISSHPYNINILSFGNNILSNNNDKKRRSQTRLSTETMLETFSTPCEEEGW